MSDIRLTKVEYVGTEHLYIFTTGDNELLAFDRNNDGQIDDVRSLFDRPPAVVAQYRPKIQQLVTRFRTELPQELQSLAERYAILPKTTETVPDTMCSKGYSWDRPGPQTTRINTLSRGVAIQYVDQGATADRVSLQTKSGIDVFISSTSPRTIRQPKWDFDDSLKLRVTDFGDTCTEINPSRKGVEEYLRLFDEGTAP